MTRQGLSGAVPFQGLSRICLQAAHIIEICPEFLPMQRGAVELTEPDCHQFVTMGRIQGLLGPLQRIYSKKRCPGKFGTYRASSAPSAGLKIWWFNPVPVPPFFSPICRSGEFRVLNELDVLIRSKSLGAIVPKDCPERSRAGGCDLLPLAVLVRYLHTLTLPETLELHVWDVLIEPEGAASRGRPPSGVCRARGWHPVTAEYLSYFSIT